MPERTRRMRTLKKKESVSAFISGIIAFGSSYMLAKLFSLLQIPTYSFVYLAVFLLEYAALRKMTSETYFQSGREKKAAGIFGYLFAFCFLLGMDLTCVGTLRGSDMIMVMIAAIGSSTLAAVVYPRICMAAAEVFGGKSIARFEKEDGKRGLLFWAVIFAAWIPVFLAYYPGILGYDVGVQMAQQAGSYTTHHPLIHTFFLKLCFAAGEQLGSDTVGMAFYSVIQMLILSGVLAQALQFLCRLQVHKAAVVACWMFFCLLPVGPLLGISTTKDTLFAAVFLLVCICLGYWAVQEELLQNKKICRSYVVAVMLCCLLRNNAVYVMVLLLLCGVALWKGMTRKKFVRLTCASILGAVLINQVLAVAVDADKGSANEMLSIPYQQISCTYIRERDQLPEEMAADILELIPSVGGYTPHIADPVKYDARGLENPTKFLRVYFSLMVKYPKWYIEAFLMNTIGFWYVDDVSAAEIYGVSLEYRQGYMQTNVTGFGVAHTSLLPGLEDFYERMFSANEYQNLPIVSVLFAPAFYTWILLFALFYMMQERKKKMLLPVLLQFLLILTMLLGPCVLVRYIYPYLICVPVVLAVAFRQCEPVSETTNDTRKLGKG